MRRDFIAHRKRTPNVSGLFACEKCERFSNFYLHYLFSHQSGNSAKMQALKQVTMAREAALLASSSGQAPVEDDYDGKNMIRLITGDQKKVQMIPLELTAAVAAAAAAAAPPQPQPFSPATAAARSSVIVQESNSNSNFDEENNDQDDDDHEDGSSSPKRLKIDLSASCGNTAGAAIDGEDSNRSLDGLSVASSVSCSSLAETENTHSSSCSQLGGKKRKQSNPQKVVSTAAAETTKKTGAKADGDNNAGEEDELRETEEKEKSNGGDKVEEV